MGFPVATPWFYGTGGAACSSSAESGARGPSSDDTPTTASDKADQAANDDAAAKSTITCSLVRLPVTPQGEGSVSVSIDATEEGASGTSEGLDAFEGNYNFFIEHAEGKLEVFFFENKHVQDEVGGMTCDPADANEQGVFCEEPINTDKFLGTDGDQDENVHTFDFSCHVKR